MDNSYECVCRSRSQTADDVIPGFETLSKLSQGLSLVTWILKQLLMFYKTLKAETRLANASNLRLTTRSFPESNGRTIGSSLTSPFHTGPCFTGRRTASDAAPEDAPDTHHARLRRRVERETASRELPAAEHLLRKRKCIHLGVVVAALRRHDTVRGLRDDRSPARPPRPHRTVRTDHRP